MTISRADMCEHAGLRRDSEVRAQIVEHDEYISYPVWAIGSPITRPRHGTTKARLYREAGRRHMSAPISCGCSLRKASVS